MDEKENFRDILESMLPKDIHAIILEHISSLLRNEPLNIIDLQDEICTKFAADANEKKINTYSLKDIKTKLKIVPGVYLIYKDNQVIYIGETDNLARRLLGDIREARLANPNKTPFHSFIMKIMKKEEIDTERDIKHIEEDIKRILKKNFLFSYVPTESKEIAFLVEGVLIRYYYNKNPDLWNKVKKYQKQDI